MSKPKCNISFNEGGALSNYHPFGSLVEKVCMYGSFVQSWMLLLMSLISSSLPFALLDQSVLLMIVPFGVCALFSAWISFGSTNDCEKAST